MITHTQSYIQKIQEVFFTICKSDHFPWSGINEPPNLAPTYLAETIPWMKTEEEKEEEENND